MTTHVDGVADSGGGGTGTTLTAGHSWERPAPATAGGGARFLDQDSLVAYTSSGAAVPGWGVELGLASLGPDRAGLRLNTTGTIVQTGLNLSAYTIGAVTMAALFTWTGPLAAVVRAIAVVGDHVAGTTGFGVYFAQNGSDIDLIVYAGAGPGITVLKTFSPAAALTAGLHGVCVAPVDVAGTHYWRWSMDGSASVDTAMAAGYVPPTTTADLTFCSRPDAAYALPGVAHDMVVWGSLLSGANMTALTTLPGTPTYRLPVSASTGAGAIRIEAARHDPYLPLVLPARGLSLPMTVGAAVRKISY